MSASASASSATTRPTFFGLFDRSATPELDIEAQLPQPSPARTRSSRTTTSNDETTTDPIDDFFGVSRPSSSTSRSTLGLTGTRDSRHDDVRAPTLVDAEADVESLPPPYEHSIEPPAYSQVSDQPTLAMYLFKFGFLFPLFWLAGALILFSPLQAPSDWEASKPEYERQELIESMRRTEVKWAKRCLVALLITTFMVAAIAITAVFVMRS
ncbi:hypothetical protein BN946_scf184664.g2 [Trametes cinnabarina]|uniref:Transmembrane protein n=1 Tax=Pycnoporus cinnabarinus TaxID=5643 RepID=A0A060SUD6_PYCCI|nr:hypothetical protein BN946_scf184664.g2 [Trametes cinnabarina]